MKISSLCAAFLLLMVLAACSAPPTAMPATQTTAPQAVLQPTSAGPSGTVTAKLVDRKTSTPVAIQLVRLAKIVGEGTDAIYVYNEMADPGAYTSEDGSLTITDVAPGQYAIILIDANGNYATIDENEEKILTVTVEAGQTVDMGNILVELVP